MSTKNLKESYIVQIYRCERRTEMATTDHSTAELAGVVEHPVSGKRQSFQNMQELWELLSARVLEAHHRD